MSTPKNQTPDVASSPMPRRRVRRAAASVLYPVTFLFDEPHAARVVRGLEVDPGCRSFLED